MTQAKPAIHQFHPTLVAGDAVSNHVFALQRLFASWGYESHAYALEPRRGLSAEVLPYRRLFRAVRPGDLLLLHFSIGNEVYDPLTKIDARRVLLYHNVTPSVFFEGLNPHATLQTERGRRQLDALAPRIDLAIGVSEFNRAELHEAGYARTAVAPILVDWSAYDVPPDERVLARWRSFRTRLLFVGRLSPNKRQDELVRMFAYYRNCVDPEAQLILVGNYRDQPQYHYRLETLARDLRVDGGTTFAGNVPMAELVAYYRQATCFVCLSEHEGFGVPLLEAMRFGVPVVAYDAGAVGETLGGAGVLLKEKDLAAAAEVCGLVHERPELRDALVAAGTRRVADFSWEKVAARTREVLEL